MIYYTHTQLVLEDRKCCVQKEVKKEKKGKKKVEYGVKIHANAKHFMLTMIIVMTLMLLTLFGVPGKREYGGEQKKYLTEETYTQDETVRVKLIGTDTGGINLTALPLTADSLVGRITPACSISISGARTMTNGVYYLLTLYNFTGTGKVTINMPARMLTDSNGNKSEEQMLATDIRIIKPGTWAEMNGTEVELTRANSAEYYGKVVTNYKGNASVTTTTSNYSGQNEFTVSTTYRLYYIDWDNKYGDDPGTVYLKADTLGEENTLANLFTYNETTSKVKQMNPCLFAEGVTTPDTSTENMKSVSWLLDTNEWSGLKANIEGNELYGSINYTVGAPSFEMFCDSYNSHYKLSGTSPALGNDASTTRRKIFYCYPYSSSNAGYAVGPGTEDSTIVPGYHASSAKYLVLTDNLIDECYYPGESFGYWLASPSGDWNTRVMRIAGYDRRDRKIR